MNCPSAVKHDCFHAAVFPILLPEPSKVLKMIRFHPFTGLDFEADHVAVAVLKNEVNLLTDTIAEVVQPPIPAQIG